MKLCVKCSQQKSEEEFYVDRSTDSGLSSRCKQCNRAYVKQRKLDNPEKIKKKQKEYSLRGRYNMTIEDHERMLYEQDNKCGICDVATKLVIDHCHSTGNVRMLLCINCNTKVGIIENNPGNYIKMLEYIEKFKR